FLLRRTLFRKLAELVAITTIRIRAIRRSGRHLVLLWIFRHNAGVNESDIDATKCNMRLRSCLQCALLSASAFVCRSLFQQAYAQQRISMTWNSKTSTA